MGESLAGMMKMFIILIRKTGEGLASFDAMVLLKHGSTEGAQYSAL
jgi:hypothetical protein